MKIFFILIFILINFTNAQDNKDEITEALPNVLFTYEKLQRENNASTLQIDFNRAVNYLERGEFENAIKIFKRTQSVLDAPSSLNIGIAYYRLSDNEKAKKYLKKIYDNKELVFSNSYVYISSSYYLYKISEDKTYLDELVSAARSIKRDLNENEKRILANTYILLKDYANALKILELIPNGVDLKKAILYIKLNDLETAEIFLERARSQSLDEDELDAIYWFMMYRDLKSNDIAKIRNRLNILSERTADFNMNQILPLEVVFNKYKYTPSQYLDSVVNYPIERQIDMAFYFAPYIFSDRQEIIYDSVRGFISNSQENIDNLDEMIRYNAQFIDIIKKDPIERVKELKDLIDEEEDAKSYVYYNLALSFAHIQDFVSANENFLKAYKLNPGNKLYAAMTLISAKRINAKAPNKEYIRKNIFNEFGMYNYFGQSLYDIFISESKNLKNLKKEYNSSILTSAIEIFKKIKANEELNGYEELFTKYYKDPLVHLMKMTIKEINEIDFNYISRLQDTIPLVFNKNFIDNSAVVTEFYIDTLKGLGLLDRASFNNVTTSYTPSYLRSFAIKLIYDNESNTAIAILEYLLNKYDLKDRYMLYAIVAAYLADDEYNQALLQISLIKALLNDSDANFLSGVELIKEMKINSAKQYFEFPYNNRIIDFNLKGIDKYLETL